MLGLFSFLQAFMLKGYISYIGQKREENELRYLFGRDVISLNISYGVSGR